MKAFPRSRPKLVKTDPEMQRWCALLETEISTWPGVTGRPMFGLYAYYRAGRIFTAIPRTRAVETPFSLLIKRSGAADHRLAKGQGPGTDWVAFAMESEAHLSDALRQLGLAYEQAGKRTTRRAHRVRR
jgi:hypothetical protein